MRTWHDFHITGYSVAGKRQEISFELEWPYESEIDVHQALVTFHGVEGYYLEHDLGSNIVYSFSEEPLQAFVEEWSQRFEEECKWGWPKFWRPKPFPQKPIEVTRQEALEYLEKGQVKCFSLSSSYGLSGWVLATHFQDMPLMT